MVLLTPTSVEQPLEAQSPDDPGEEREPRGGAGNIGKQRGGEGREREERKRGGALRLESCPLRSPYPLPILPREDPPGPTFSHVPEYTAEGHVLKPEIGSRGEAGEVGRGERRVGRGGGEDSVLWVSAQARIR